VVQAKGGWQSSFLLAYHPTISKRKNNKYKVENNKN
jgi:hypothetical protein